MRLRSPIGARAPPGCARQQPNAASCAGTSRYAIQPRTYCTGPLLQTPERSPAGFDRGSSRQLFPAPSSVSIESAPVVVSTSATGTDSSRACASTRVPARVHAQHVARRRPKRPQGSLICGRTRVAGDMQREPLPSYRDGVPSHDPRPGMAPPESPATELSLATFFRELRLSASPLVLHFPPSGPQEPQAPGPTCSTFLRDPFV